MARPLAGVLDEGVARGVISAEQRDALFRLSDELAGPAPGSPEAPRGFSGVNIAYGIGALLVLFAFGWFMVTKWETLGGLGVLGVTLVYAAILVGAGWQLTRLGFPRAAGIAFMLAVSLTPLVAWSALDLTGEWPRVPPNDSIYRYQPWMATRYLVLDLATLLVALLTWRRRRFPALILPIAVALWWTWFHLSQLVELGGASDRYQKWIVMACSLGLLAAADMIERWQRRTGVREAEGDYAGPLWYVGLFAFTIGYLVLWAGAGPWKHAMPAVAAGLLALSLATGRRGIAFVGVLGVFGYLAYLAGDVFRTGAAFPLVLAALGILTILATVWLQRRLPAITRRASGSDRQPPWPVAASWLPAIASLVIAVGALSHAGEDRARRDREQRDAILKRHAEVQQKKGPGR